MGDAISGIAEKLGGWGNIALGGMAGAGEIGNIINARRRGRQVSELQDAEKKFTSLTPEQLSGMVTRAEQPLDAGLTQAINNVVQADMASRGLAQAPGIFAATEAQALAPYKLQQQQMALQLVLKQMGLPIEYADAVLRSIGPDTNIVPILLAIMRGRGGGATGGIPDTSGIPSNTGNILSEIIGSQYPGLETPPTFGTDNYFAGGGT